MKNRTKRTPAIFYKEYNIFNRTKTTSAIFYKEYNIFTYEPFQAMVEVFKYLNENSKFHIKDLDKQVDFDNDKFAQKINAKLGKTIIKDSQGFAIELSTNLENDPYSSLGTSWSDAYNQLISNGVYFYGCPISIYIETYPKRFTDYESILSDAKEIDFIREELDKGIYSIRIYDSIQRPMERDVNMDASLARRFEFLRERAKALGYDINPKHHPSKVYTSGFTKRESYILESIPTPAPQQLDTNTLIDLSSVKAKEKVVYLEILGVLDLLKHANPSLTPNGLATLLSAITKEKTSTLQPYLNAMKDGTNADSRNPMYNDNIVSKVRTQLTNLGINQHK